MRPVLADPPLCRLHHLRTVYTLCDLHDFHEALDMRDALAAKVAEAEGRDHA